MLYRYIDQSRYMNLELSEGSLTLRTACPPQLVEELETDRGLRAFSRRPEHEHQRLLDITQQPENVLSIAYTPAGVIIGQITLVPFYSWGATNTYEIAAEVSSPWRRRGIARLLLALSLESLNAEDMIILGFGLSWHWDITGLGITPASYRAMLVQFLAYYGFMDCPTNEANISMDPSNVLLARIGTCVPVETTVQFYNDLFKPELL